MIAHINYKNKSQNWKVSNFANDSRMWEFKFALCMSFTMQRFLRTVLSSLVKLFNRKLGQCFSCQRKIVRAEISKVKCHFSVINHTSLTPFWGKELEWPFWKFGKSFCTFVMSISWGSTLEVLQTSMWSCWSCWQNSPRDSIPATADVLFQDFSSVIQVWWPSKICISTRQNSTWVTLRSREFFCPQLGPNSASENFLAKTGHFGWCKLWLALQELQSSSDSTLFFQAAVNLLVVWLNFHWTRDVFTLVSYHTLPPPDPYSTRPNRKFGRTVWDSFCCLLSWSTANHSDNSLIWVFTKGCGKKHRKSHGWSPL